MIAPGFERCGDGRQRLARVLLAAGRNLPRRVRSPEPSNERRLDWQNDEKADDDRPDA
jgi:hypothetical protein